MLTTSEALAAQIAKPSPRSSYSHDADFKCRPCEQGRRNKRKQFKNLERTPRTLDGAKIGKYGATGRVAPIETIAPVKRLRFAVAEDFRTEANR